MAEERKSAVTLKGNPFTLVGPELKVGDKVPDFEVVGIDLKPVSLADTGNGIRIFSVVPSLDTPVCDLQSRRFNQEAGKIPEVKIFTISMDLPFAQKRWCGASDSQNLTMLSDHRSGSFGSGYGTLIKELRLNCRAVFVVDSDNTLRYVQYVPEVGDEPNYEEALQAVRELTQA